MTRVRVEGRGRRCGRRRGGAGGLVAGWLLAGLTVLTVPTAAASPPGPRDARAEGFVGRAACSPCHARAAERFAGSHHDLAMAAADASTVRADFADATFTYAGTTTHFFRRENEYWVRTDGPDGAPAEYRIEYTFGVEPLQQYLIALPGGRLQALSVAWDTRPPSAGGQRWFHLYPDEAVDHADPLHWTKPAQNWNDRCARCHSTDLRKGYQAAGDRYETTWTEIDVSCEACHGPGAKHVAWAGRVPRPGGPSKGLRVRQAGAGRWVFDGTNPIARRTGPPAAGDELETCAPCHARRSDLGDGSIVGVPFLDGHRPALLDDGLYFPDGQILDEVYVWGSFQQSRMRAAGVTCSDCHEPHALTLRAEGNALCARCHAPAHYDAPSHHRHPQGSAGARCVACHMPSRTYMEVDDRRDHGFRVPRPDLAAALGTPEPCTTCHDDHDAAWAAEALADGRAGRPPAAHFGEAIAAGRRGAADAEAKLVRLANAAGEPVIVRATAVSLLAGYAGPDATQTLVSAARAPEPLLRHAAAGALDGRDPELVIAAVGPLLRDPVRVVRLEAVPPLAAVAERLSSGGLDEAFVVAEAEHRAVQLAAADRPESHLALALVALRRGRVPEAEQALRTAMRLAPYFVPAYVNLADLYRMQGRDAEAEPVLRAVLAEVPGSADAQHALGLLQVRTGRAAEALETFRRAATLAPEDTRHAYVLGVALYSLGDAAGAIGVLRAAHERRPGDVDVLVALTTMSRDTGDLGAARRWATRLVEVVPWDAGARRLRAELGASP
jgi:tetratricopeptide (TPR) repeat protein